nr:hypothetical protein [uncultured Acetatifactor sp.]
MVKGTDEEGREDPLFYGTIQETHIFHENGVGQVILMAASESARMDMRKRSRSFQDTSLSCAKVMRGIVSEYGGTVDCEDSTTTLPGAVDAGASGSTALAPQGTGIANVGSGSGAGGLTLLPQISGQAATYAPAIPDVGNSVTCPSGGGGTDTVYIPRDEEGNPIPLDKQTVNGQDIPLPDPSAEGRPHTVLGGKISSKTGEDYRQSATFPGGTWPTVNGHDVPWSEVHWTDYGTPHHHTNPHQHIFEYNPDKGGWIRKGPTIFEP